MDTPIAKRRFRLFSAGRIKVILSLILLATAVVGAIAFRHLWLPHASQLISSIHPSANEAGDLHTMESEAEHEHAGHDHDHEGHQEEDSIELSPQAQKNLDLRVSSIALGPYIRSLSIPATVIGRPGRSLIEVTAPLGGRVIHAYPIDGEAIVPGQKLYELQLTHEELVQAQSNLLTSAEQLDVEEREIRRLEEIATSGVIPGRRLLERQYEKQKLEAVLNAQKQSLLLHGLTQPQIDQILQTRKLVRDVTVYAPGPIENSYGTSGQQPFSVRRLYVKPGQYVDAGEPLCQLADYAQLYIQGRAFEHDANELLKAAQESWNVSAMPEDNGSTPDPIRELKIVYVDNEVDPESRALHFYVGLPNQVVNDNATSGDHRFLTWKYKPGQRMQLQVPVEQWMDRIVLPVDAIAKEGVENYVFQQNGDHFDRRPVQVEFQDQFTSVIANDGSLFPGDMVAMNGAHQLQMALKNKAGGGVDPHAGHNH